MKTKLLVIAVVAILVSACTTGTHMTKSYDDDIYFSPADAPPIATLQKDAPVKSKPTSANNYSAKDQRIVMSQVNKNTDGSLSVNNQIYQPKDANQNSNVLSYNMNNQDLAKSDTTVYYNDDEVKYVINNYYDDNNTDPDFTYRINRFHRPYYYSPFYDDWSYSYYSPYYSGFYGYDSWYGGWGYPYSYGYSPYYSFGLGFCGLGFWGLGFDYGYGGYYNGYYGGGGGYYGGGYYSNREVSRRRPTNMNLPGNVTNSNNSAIGGRTSNSRIERQENQSAIQNGSRSTWTENGHVRSRSIDASGNNQNTQNATLINNRRSDISTEGRRSSAESNPAIQRTQTSGSYSNASGNVRRSYEPSTTGRTYNQSRTVIQNQNYTPSYNKPRIVNQSNYNNSYSRSRTTNSENGTVVRSYSGNPRSTYSAPQSTSNMRQTYRSSSSYSTRSSSSPSRSSSNYSSSPSYSSPSRSSYSSGSSSSGSSNSGGGGYSGGNSGGGSSGGGSGHRR